jgi:hypothetical protein
MLDLRSSETPRGSWRAAPGENVSMDAARRRGRLRAAGAGSGSTERARRGPELYQQRDVTRSGPMEFTTLSLNEQAARCRAAESHIE